MEKSIAAHVSDTLHLIRHLTAMQDAERVIDALQLLITQTAPKVEESVCAGWEARLAALDDEDDDARAFRACMSVLREILRALALHGIYADMPGQVGDARHLALRRILEDGERVEDAELDDLLDLAVGEG